MNQQLEHTTQQLRARLQQELPGFTAQEMMAPKLRYNLTDLELARKKAKPSSVLISLYSKNGDITTILTQRHAYRGVHSNQISFPGGKKEVGDKNLKDTALREACEEVNLCREDVDVLGHLTPLYIPPSNFLVTPFVAYVKSRPELIPQESEVKEILEVPVKHFLNPELLRHKMIWLAHGKASKTPYFDIGGRVVWGATAMILGELVAVLHDIGFH